MASKLTLVYFLLFAALELAHATCDNPGQAAACDAFCWLVLPNFDDIPYRYGCLDSDGDCWCCDPRLTTTTTPAPATYYGGYGYGANYNRLSYACPEPGNIACNNDANCKSYGWFLDC